MKTWKKMFCVETSARHLSSRNCSTESETLSCLHPELGNLCGYLGVLLHTQYLRTGARLGLRGPVRFSEVAIQSLLSANSSEGHEGEWGSIWNVGGLCGFCFCSYY